MEMKLIYAKTIGGSGAKVWSLGNIANLLNQNNNKLAIYTNHKFLNFIKKNIINKKFKKITIISNFIDFIFFNIFQKKKLLNFCDYPLPFFKKQTLYINQANLIYPKKYKFSSTSFNFKLRRLYFNFFKHNISEIKVQSFFMKKKLQESYNFYPKVKIEHEKVFIKKTTLSFKYKKKKY